MGQQDSAGCDLCDSGYPTTAEAIVRVNGHLTAFYGLSAAYAVGETDTQSVDLATETVDATRAFVALAFLGSNRGSVWGYFGARNRFWLGTVEHLQARRGAMSKLAAKQGRL